MNNFIYQKVHNIAEATACCMNTPGSQYVGGGTNLIDLWKYNLIHPTSLIDLTHIDVGHDVRERDDGGLRIGAFVTNADTAYHPLIEQRYPLLSRAILAGASGQIRNMATNGGNLLQRTRCYYFYDHDLPCNKRNPGSGCPAIEGYNRMHAILGTSDDCIAVYPSDMSVALAALEAWVNVTGPNGERSIAFEQFHRLPGNTPHIENDLQAGEIITSIDLPSEGFAANYSYLKIRDRNSYAFALLSVATGLTLRDGVVTSARIALGGVAHKPWRKVDAEQFLLGKTPDEDNFRKAATILLEGARAFKHNGFKIELAHRAIVRNGLMALQPSSQLPGAQPSV
ncbi:xanthine dehydrogenase family protein subunit M [Chryseolinea sp. T2]|uniref:FAD binding domain-containing protein n=1 Tax=Chryseolinea sp. T2 TaxID=3129255 RepID=UPI0030789729